MSFAEGLSLFCAFVGVQVLLFLFLAIQGYRLKEHLTSELKPISKMLSNHVTDTNKKIEGLGSRIAMFDVSQKLLLERLERVNKSIKSSRYFQ